MGDKRASLFATDPPYCVDYTGKNRPGGGKDWSDIYHEIDIKNANEFYHKFFVAGLKYCIDSAAIYLWYHDKKRSMVDAVCNNLGLLIHQQIIWVKPAALMSFTIYAWQHEPGLL